MRKRAGKTTDMARIESLENRRMLSVDFIGEVHAPLGGSSGPVIERGELQRRQIRRILGQAASQARDGQVIAVVDREGFILGIYAVGDVEPIHIIKAVLRARTGAYFQSSQDAFSTRTARFIVQDRFPNDVPNTPGGPLYGVQFSSLPGTDILSLEQTPGVSGDPGGIPLFDKQGRPVGGIGVAGDGQDTCVRRDLVGDDFVCPAGDNPDGKFYVSAEENDFDEAVALAGAQGFMAPEAIQATKIFIDGLRFPFIKDEPADANPTRTLGQLTDDGVGELIAFPTLGKTSSSIEEPPPETHPTAAFAGIPGHIMNPILDSDDKSLGKDALTAADVRRVISDAVRRAKQTRAAIRLPIGTPAIVHVAVVDLDGDVIGVFRMEDGTRFSYDVAVQKARTAAFFSDDRHAFSSRAIGFMSQGFFPVGIQDGPRGPLFGLQNELSLTDENGDLIRDKFIAPLANGITIFPGGAPLYKNGKLVGAVGISGDGVDQDDIIAYTGTKDFRPNIRSFIRSDQLPERKVVRFITRKVREIDDLVGLSDDLLNKIFNRFERNGIGDIRLPYVKFPRNPNV